MFSGDGYICDLCLSLQCTLCPQYTARLGIENTRFQVVKCGICGLKSLYPLPTPDDLVTIYKNYADKGDLSRLFDNVTVLTR